MRFANYARCAAALLLFALAFAGPARAQNNKPISSGTWYEDRASVSNSSYYAAPAFAQIPADKFLDITHVTCTIRVESGQNLTTVYLYAGSTSGSADLGRPMSIRGNTTFEAANSGKYYSLVTDQILYKFGPGRYPSIFVQADSGGQIFVDCVIVGELKDN